LNTTSGDRCTLITLNRDPVAGTTANPRTALEKRSPDAASLLSQAIGYYTGTAGLVDQAKARGVTADKAIVSRVKVPSCQLPDSGT
jgi:hypothetical protein